MQILDECHARGFLHVMTGGCNDAKRNVNACLRAERLERTAKNREKAKIEREQTLQVWREIDEKSCGELSGRTEFWVSIFGFLMGW